MNETINNIPLEDIIPSGHNRAIGGFDQEKLEQLAQSIREVGVQQPAVVRIVAGGLYELVAGERRWRASKIAGVSTLPCVIRDLDDEAALRIQIVENLQRENVHPLDEAEGYARLKKEGHCEIEYIAQQIGRSTAYVYQRLKLLDLISSVRKALVDGVMTPGHAILIARLPKDQQSEALDIWYEGMSVKELDRRIQSNLLMQLSTATWKLDDAELYPLAGSCKECAKRSGAAPLLFGDIGKKDQCLDKECFAEKRLLQIKARMLEVKNEPHILVKSGYAYGEKTPEGTLESHEWTECRKKDKGSVRTLIVSGPDAGRLTWGIPKVTAAGKRVLRPEEKAKNAKERATKAAAIELREKLFDGIALATTSEIPEALLLEATKESWRQMNWDGKRLMAKHLGFEKRPEQYGNDGFEGAFQDWLVGKSRGELETMRIMILYAGYLFLSNLDYLPLNKAFVAAAHSAGIDVDAMVASAATSAGLTPQELNPPPRNYGYDEDDEEQEGDDADPS